MSEEIPRIRSQHPDIPQKEAFSVAAKNWSLKKEADQQREKELQVSAPGTGPYESDGGGADDADFQYVDVASSAPNVVLDMNGYNNVEQTSTIHLQ